MGQVERTKRNNARDVFDSDHYAGCPISRALCEKWDVRQVGGQGYVLKSQAARDLVLAIDTILSGGAFFGALPDSKPLKSGKPNPGTLLRVALAI
jgi:hypothetical protein